MDKELVLNDNSVDPLIKNRITQSCSQNNSSQNNTNYSGRQLVESNNHGSKKVFIQSYGCQMNFSDSEIVSSILTKEGFNNTPKIEEADLVLLNTCSIREKAEQTIRNRLTQINTFKKSNPKLIVGVLGCMAERLKKKFLEEEKLVDLVAGPDAYRSLPALIGKVSRGDKAINTFLSRHETYSDISPERLNTNGVSGFISIMRGCDNMCSFCVVPFTRGRERSRDPESILREAQKLFDDGYREVTLLGQNVDSYKWKGLADENKDKTSSLESVNFAQLLGLVAKIDSQFRVRFSTSHPKDITDDVLYTMAEHENICRYIHLPVQSGNSRILKLMNRGYSREWYLQKIDRIREILGYDCGISSDMISGFCSETEAEHIETLSLMESVKFDFAYMFMYSERPGTLAANKYADDVTLESKQRRLQEIISMQNRHSLERNNRDVGKVFKVLIEGFSKRSDEFLYGRNTANKVIVFPKENRNKGDYVNVIVESCSKATLVGKIIF